MSATIKVACYILSMMGVLCIVCCAWGVYQLFNYEDGGSDE